MARPRIQIDPAIEAEIALRTRRGESAATIHLAVPGAPSTATIARRQRDLRDRELCPTCRRPLSAAS